MALRFLSATPEPAFTLRDLQCLADTIYYEARGTSIYEQMLVAQVVINRRNHDRWPKTICKIVWQSEQFSWTRADHAYVRKQAKDPISYFTATEIAASALSGHFSGLPENIYFFHVRSIPRPDYVGKLIVKNAQQLFYDLPTVHANSNFATVARR